MSAENVEIVRRAMEAWNRRDRDYFDELFTPDFEWFPPLSGAVEGRSSYTGREGGVRYREDVSDTWEKFRVDPGEFRDLGDRVLVLGRIEGRGRGSGVPVDASIGMVFEFRGGRISRARGYLDNGEALRAAGLTE
jgi:ketosteroid isomerase-like protein